MGSENASAGSELQCTQAIVCDKIDEVTTSERRARERRLPKAMSACAAEFFEKKRRSFPLPAPIKQNLPCGGFWFIESGSGKRTRKGWRNKNNLKMLFLDDRRSFLQLVRSDSATKQA